MAEYHGGVFADRIGNAVVVRFAANRWYDEVTIYELRRDLFNLVETSDAKAVVLNLATVDDSGATGIHMLIRIQQQALAKGIALRLSNLQPRMEEPIRIAQLNGFLSSTVMTPRHWPLWRGWISTTAPRSFFPREQFNGKEEVAEKLDVTHTRERQSPAA